MLEVPGQLMVQVAASHRRGGDGLCAPGCPPVRRFLDPLLEFSMNLGLPNLHSVLPPGREAAVCHSLQVMEGEALTGLTASQSGSQISAFKPAVLASPGNLLELQIIRSHPSQTESESLGGMCRNLYLDLCSR